MVQSHTSKQERAISVCFVVVVLGGFRMYLFSESYSGSSFSISWRKVSFLVMHWLICYNPATSWNTLHGMYERRQARLS